MSICEMLIARARKVASQAALIELDAGSPQAFDPAARLALKSLASMIVEFCRETVQQATLAAGANAFRKSSKLQMLFRDISMISVHPFFDSDAATEACGRLLLGYEPEGLA